MLKEAMEHIENRTRPIMMTIKGRDYNVNAATGALSPIREPLPSTLNLTTLTGLMDYLYEGPDNIETGSHVLHVVSPTCVEFISEVFGPFSQRDLRAQATCEDQNSFPFGTFITTETFIIDAQVSFCPTEDLNTLLKIAGNVTETLVRTHEDDGVTQTVTARTGIARKADIDVPRLVTLKPYWTFSEIAQPELPFLFRMRSGSADQKPSCALFKADGNMWRAETMQNIKAWLTAAMKSRGYYEPNSTIFPVLA